MSVFADTSALLKLYVDEVGHDVVRAVGEPVILSQLVRVELPSALWRKMRRGQSDAHDVALVVAEFEADYYGTEETEPRFEKVQLADRVLAEAARIAARVELRAGHAIQLASALAARHADRHAATMATFDARLRTAAAMEGFRLIPPTIS